MCLLCVLVYNQSKNRAKFASGENNQIQLFETIFTYLEFQNHKDNVQKWGAKIMRSVRFVFKKLSTLIWILKMTHTHSNPIFGLNMEHQQLFDRANKKKYFTWFHSTGKYSTFAVITSFILHFYLCSSVRIIQLPVFNAMQTAQHSIAHVQNERNE